MFIWGILSAAPKLLFMVDDMALGRNIRRLRDLLGETRPALARAIGIASQQPIYALEMRDSVRSDLAPVLAKHYGLDLEVLLTHDLSMLSADELNLLKEKSTGPRGSLPGAKAREVAEKYSASDSPLRKAVDDLLDLSPADAAKVAALIAAFKNGKPKT
jgi:transcriptional regulator with XRE-family HTH domain